MHNDFHSIDILQSNSLFIINVFIYLLAFKLIIRCAYLFNRLTS